MKLVQIKQQVYKTGIVSNTQELKRKLKKLNLLDMRLKDSWLEALALVQEELSSTSINTLQRDIELAQERWETETREINSLSEQTNNLIAELQGMKEDEKQLQSECSKLIAESTTHLDELAKRSETRYRASLN